MNDPSGDYNGITDYPSNTDSNVFLYDSSGNMAYEPNKVITVAYNLLNLPREMTFTTNRKIKYFYTFDGSKLRQTVENNGTITKVDYCGLFVYETASGVRSLKYIITPEGRVLKDGSNWIYEYNLKDHLGNTRVAIRDGGGGIAAPYQFANYYAFGMDISMLSDNLNDNKYLYNGKERKNDFGLDWYDYGARMYDPELGRWHSVDALAEDYYDLSPYNYAGNNPICYIDPDGNFKTRFGAWLYSVFNGGGDILQDKGGEYFVGQKVENEGDADITYKRSFDWGGRGEGKDLALEAQIDAFITQNNFARTLDQAGIEYSYTNDRGEAQRSMLSLSTIGLLPNPLLKSATALVNSGRAATGASNLAIRSEIVLNGGRSGQLVKTLTGPANSVLKGGQGRIFVTNDAGKVIWDITKDRAKSVIPGQGFGSKVAPTQEQLNLLKQVWGN